MQVEYSYLIKPLLEALEESGDLIFTKETDHEFCFGVIDALGHGKEANKAAKTALDYLEQTSTTDPASDIKNIHELLKQTRGAVLSLCSIDKNTGSLKTCGVGNITTKILGDDPKRVFFRDGIVGYSLPSLENQTFSTYAGDIILLYSDGIKENFDLIDVPGITQKTAKEISAVLLDKYSKKNDDSSILTVKVKYD